MQLANLGEEKRSAEKAGRRLEADACSSDFGLIWFKKLFVRDNLTVAENNDVLKKRIRRFLESAPSERRDVVQTIAALQEIAEIYIFGGLMRDLALSGIANFNSDVDIVVVPFDREIFSQWIIENGFIQNKFGGFRLSKNRWLFDVWELDKTWAYSNCDFSSTTKYSLVETTFFNWDAILFDVRYNQIICKDNYYQDIAQRRLEINFAPNPNYLGCLVRSLKFISREGVSTGPALTEFIRHGLSKYSDTDILNYDRTKSRIPSLRPEFVQKIRIRKNLAVEGVDFNWISKKQMTLF